MGILGKLAFWKHEKAPGPEPSMDLGADLNLGSTTGMPSDIGQQPNLGLEMGPQTGLESGFTAPPQPEPFTDAPASQPNAMSQMRGQQKNEEVENLAKNVELITAKVDTIRVILDQLSHKINNIEKIAMAEEEDSHKRKW